MVLKANDRRTSCPCHDEFRGPRSDYVRHEKEADMRMPRRICESKHIKDIQTSMFYVGDKPTMVILDYIMDISDILGSFDRTDSEYTKKGRYHGTSVE
ncbi:methyltranfer_dom domain-containing protein [Trichonephila clavipes]|nr:methyltranfer_dom domain-containing protein [Trichonephila clavipes]